MIWRQAGDSEPAHESLAKLGKSYRCLFDSVASQVRGLRALGVSSEPYGRLLTSILLNKLPPEIQLIISSELSGAAWNLDKMMEVTETKLIPELAIAYQN